MSPRRRFESDEHSLLVATEVTPPWWQRLPRFPLTMVIAGLVTIEAITGSALMLTEHEVLRREKIREVGMLADVKAFMTLFTSPDPYHANDYVDRVLEHATGDFHTDYEAKENMALAKVVQSQPATGSVLSAALQRWNDDGTANVLVATNVNSKTKDGKQTFDVVNRWLVTAQKEGDQWKISSLTPVI